MTDKNKRTAEIYHSIKINPYGVARFICQQNDFNDDQIGQSFFDFCKDGDLDGAKFVWSLTPLDRSWTCQALEVSNNKDVIEWLMGLLVESNKTLLKEKVIKNC